MNNDFNVNSFEHFQPYNSYWGNYDSMIKEMSNDQKNFVGKQDEVKNAKNLLISAFIDYLFEQNKNNFVRVKLIGYFDESFDNLEFLFDELYHL